LNSLTNSLYYYGYFLLFGKTVEYKALEIEKKWQEFWDRNNTFKVSDKSDKKLYVLDMFPYPSGAGLHIGHPLGYTGTDIFSRYKRLQGYQVLHPMGYDAFGLPAEQHAINTGEHPANITKKNCANFTKQLKQLGFSYDWSREIATCDPDYYKWTQWIFLKIYNSWFDEKLQKARPIEELPIPNEIKAKGEKAICDYQAEYRLAYIADAMVNWCPALGTVLANEEVIDGKSERGGHDVIRKPMRQWLLRITKYSERLLNELENIEWPENIKEQQRNWIGKKKGAEIEFQLENKDLSLRAFTTRPDTLFGVTFFVISPEHPLVQEVTSAEYKTQVENYIEASAKLSDLARTMDNREKTGQFTGSYVVNPISKDKVPLYIGDYVLMSFGTGAVMGVPAHDERDFEFAKKFNLPIKPVIAPKEDKIRAKIISGELCWTEAGEMLPCDFQIASELKLLGKSNEEAQNLITNWLEVNSKGKGVVNYRLRDWLFSRQRYWGEPIPIVHWSDGTISAISENELPLTLPEVKDYKPSDGGESPLAKAKDWLDVTCPKTGKKGRRETNTMPQWAGSCWYYLRFIDPHNSERGWDPELEKHWMPVDWYVGGAEHAVLHLLYSRFWHKVLFDLGYVSTNEPFQKLFNQGMLVSFAYKDNRGALIPVDEVEEQSENIFVHKKTGQKVERITAKMSKSLKNVVNPEDVISKYGADTLRVYLMFMGPLEAMKTWDDKAITGCNRFIKKSFSFISSKLNELVSEEQESKEAKQLLHQTIHKVTESLDTIRFNTAVSHLMEFVNNVSSLNVSKKTLKDFTIMLSPLAPHVAEEMWNVLGNNESVVKANWPSCDPQLLQKDQVTLVVQIAGKKRATIDVATTISDDQIRDSVVKLMSGTNYEVKPVDKFITVRDKKSGVPKLVNIIIS
jgi:leucyl-tRNA synthetase